MNTARTNPRDDGQEMTSKSFTVLFQPFADKDVDVTVNSTLWKLTFLYHYNVFKTGIRAKVKLIQCGDKDINLPIYAEFGFSNESNQDLGQVIHQGSFYENNESAFIELTNFTYSYRDMSSPCFYKIQCDISLFPKFSPAPKPGLTFLPPGNLTKGIAPFLNNSEFSDVSIHIGDRRIPAHKVILSAASPVFAKLLKGNDENTNISKLELNDASYEKMLKVLSYIYTENATVSKIDEHADEILEIAERYQLDRLKAYCETVLIGKLNAGNACDLFIKASLCNAEQLRRSVEAFVQNNLFAVKKTEGFQKLAETHYHLLLQLLRVRS